MQPQGRRPQFFCHQQQGNDDVPRDEDGEIGRGVIRSLVLEIEAATAAMGFDRDVAGKKLALATGRASAS
jgi:hypothetical protein